MKIVRCLVMQLCLAKGRLSHMTPSNRRGSLWPDSHVVGVTRGFRGANDIAIDPGSSLAATGRAV